MVNPARVAGAITTVRSEVSRWLMLAHGVDAESQRILRSAEESARRASRTAAIVADDHETLRGAAGTEEQKSQKARTDVAQLRSAVDDRAGSVELLSDYTARLVQAWQAELSEALAWRARAEERVRQAEAWVRRAVAAVGAAKSRLSSAESALRRCNNDRDRRSCASEAAAVNAARIALQAALVDLERAEAELRLARAELEMAKRRVACCERAVDLARQAASEAESASLAMLEAHHQTEFADNYARDAQVAAGLAAANVEVHASAVESMRVAARQARTRASEAVVHVRNAHHAYQTAGRHGADATRDLGDRLERLRAFDQRGGLS